MRMHHLPRVLFSLVLAAGAFAQETAKPRSAKDILRDYDRVVMPSMSDGNSPEAVARFKKQITDGCMRQAELALELQKAHPDHARLPDVLSYRWAGMTNACDLADAVAKETAALLAQDGLRADVRSKALLARSRAMLVSEAFDDMERLEAVRATIDLEGEEEYAAHGMVELVDRHIVDPETQRMLLDIVVKRWPDAKYGSGDAKRWLKVFERIGKPFAEQLPAANREWFAQSTKQPAEFTVVQLWMAGSIARAMIRNWRRCWR